MSVEQYFDAEICLRFNEFANDVVLNSCIDAISSSEEKLGQLQYHKRSILVDTLGAINIEKSLVTQKKLEFVFRLEALEKIRHEKIAREKADAHQKELERLEHKATQFASRSFWVALCTGIAAIIAVILSFCSLYVSYRQVSAAEDANKIASEQNQIMRLESSKKVKGEFMKAIPDVYSMKNLKNENCFVFTPSGSGIPKVDWNNSTIAYPPANKVEPMVSWKNKAGDLCYGSEILKAAVIDSE